MSRLPTVARDGLSYLLTGPLVVLAAFVLLALAHCDRSAFYLASVLRSTGIGLAFTAMANLIVGTVPPDRIGVVTGISIIVWTVGAAVGSQVAGTILA